MDNKKAKKAIVAKIDALIKELERLDIKAQTFSETIAHLRSRQERIARRKIEIHDEIADIKKQVSALTDKSN